MNKQPINAAELVLKGRTGLSRYKTIPGTLTKLSGWLEDVETTGDDDAWIVIRPVDGLPGHNMATATIRNPAPEVDQLLKRIGRNGRITLIGIASTKTDGIAHLRLTEVHSINGTPVAATRR